MVVHLHGYSIMIFSNSNAPSSAENRKILSKEST